MTAWSGSFALRIVYDVLHRRNIDFGKRERKPLVAEPLIRGGKYLLSGLYRSLEGDPHPRFCWREVKAGSRLTLSVHFLREDVARAFLEGLVEEQTLEEPACNLAVQSISYRYSELPDPEPVGEEVKVFKVKFLSPTAFMFYGRDVLYPSPARLVLSALKSYGELAGVDTKEASEGVAKTAEVVYSPRCERVYVDIGEGRRVPAFLGEAHVALHGSRDIPLLVAALKSAELLGVGISRAVGFGRISVEEGEHGR